MKNMIIAAGILIALVAAYAVWLLNEMGEFRTVATLHPGTCVEVPGVSGGEDITVHPDGSVAYISSDDRRSVMAGEPVPGAVYAYDLQDSDIGPVNLTPAAGRFFRPHGIDLYAGDDGREVLFVVNHPGASLFGAPAGHEGPAHTVEIFELENGALVHRDTVSGPEMISPNDVVGVGPRRFYVSNDHGSRPGLMRHFEDYLRLPRASVVYYDGEQLREVADGLMFANGINISPDGRRLYVAETTRGTVREYRRDIESGTLEPRRTMSLDFGVDNIEVDAGGDLWIGGHVKLLSFMRHVEDAAVRVPSQVDRLRLTDEDYTVETVFMDDGELISGVSVGAGSGERLLIGSVFEPHIVDCRLEPR